MNKITKRPIDTCDVAYAVGIIGGKWKQLILWRLLPGTIRFGALMRSMPAITERVLITQLKELVQDGLIERIAYPVLPPKVEYRLTPKGESLRPILLALEQWGETARQ